ncbi:MAG: phosphatase PAP2 family protein [Bacteroidota bacterium]
MMETIKTIDESLFLFMNGQHNAFFDSLMWLFSDRFFWIPLYAWFLWLLYKRYPKHYWTAIIAIALMIASSDQLCNLFKENVMRLRPSQEPHLQSFVHVLRDYNGNEYRGGSFGFYSSHASNAFAVALFLIVNIAKQRKYIIPISLSYALLTAYSRIYLGVHYPVDVLTGVITGSLLGTGFAVIHNKLRIKYLKE